MKIKLVPVGVIAGLAGLLLMTPAAWATPGGPPQVTPVSWTPSIATSGIDGSVELVRQLVPCGSMMYAVGSFTSIKQGSTLYARNNAFSFNATTGAMSSWDPNVTPGNVGTTGSGAVNSIAFSPDCSIAYLGGIFIAVHGTKVTNIAAVSTTTGAVITTFSHSATGQVAALVRVGTHLMTGGYFTAINGSSKKYLVSLNTTSGLDDGYVDMNISGNYVYTDDDGAAVKPNPTRVWNFALSPDSTKLLATGDFMSVGGAGRQQIFMLDLGSSAATLDPWYSSEFNAYCSVGMPFYLQDASWAPDMSKIYTATTGLRPANGLGHLKSDPRAGLCDSAAAFPSTASSTLSHIWINYTGCDSLYSTAADANSVYVAGHERYADNPNGCDRKRPGSVPAPGLGGISPTSGLLNYNPTRDRGQGADDLLVTSAGLWVASDNAFDSNACGKNLDGTPARGHAGICFLPY